MSDHEVPAPRSTGRHSASGECRSEGRPEEEVSTIAPEEEEISIFDFAEEVALGSIVDEFPLEAVTARGEGENETLDQLFASL